jgi:ribosomal protein S18 acetylase RimI-like enzyme
MNDIIITQATKEDLPAILVIQKKAFLVVARAFHLKTLPPLEQTLDSVTDEFMNGMILKATLMQTLAIKDDLDSRVRGNDKEDIIVGSVRAYKKADTCYIGKLIVLPEYQNKGIGKALMRKIENQYINIVKRYELFTGERDPRNRYLYDQLGYKVFKTEKLNDEISFIYMEKSA